MSPSTGTSPSTDVGEDLETASLFPAATRAQWQRLVSGVLAKSGKTGLEGEAAEQALATKLEDGVSVRPLYTAEDSAPDPGLPGLAPFTRGNRPAGAVVEGWDIRAHHADPDPSHTRAAVLTDLENGASSLWFELGGGRDRPEGDGVAEDGLAIDALPTVLEDVYLDLAGIVLDAGEQFGAAADRLFALCDERGVARDTVSGNLGADPLGLLARTGADEPTARLLAEASALAQRCLDDFPGMRALMVDATAYHDAGASAAQEIGCALGTALGYLRTLTEAGLSVEQAAAQLEFRYAADADQFLTIAKLRAARRLWALILESCDAPSAAATGRVHAVTSRVMMTERDPWVNMLRTTIAALGACVGGADSLTVLPFDAALGLPDDFARRIARNTQAILHDESHLGRVIDPAGGSWYVESLTDSLACAAWAWMQEIERAGGQHRALVSGLISERINATWTERTVRLARRREPVLGVSEFPNLTEAPLPRQPAPARPGGGLPRVRRSQEFEALRTRSDRILAETGARPAIALIALGPESVTSARSSFAANLFQGGGIETVLIRALLSPALDTAELTEAVAAAGVRAVCLCSSDTVYAEHAADAARALAKAGLNRIWLAGRAGDHAELWREAGITDYIYAGCDALAAQHAAFDATVGAALPTHPEESGVRR